MDPHAHFVRCPPRGRNSRLGAALRREWPHAQPVIRLKQGREKSLQHPHPWIFSGAIDHVEGDPASGATVLVAAADGRVLASAAFSPSSQIRARVWSFDARVEIDEAFFRQRIERAVVMRTSMLDADHNGCR